MNYGDLAYITKDEIRVPEYLIRPMNIDYNTNLTIIQYSTPSEPEEHYKHLKINHDLLITPTPFQIWPFQIRINVNLVERNGSVSEFLDFIDEENLTILSADCHRAGFRYMVYSAFVEPHIIRNEFTRKINRLSLEISNLETNNQTLESITEKLNELRSEITTLIADKVDDLRTKMEKQKENKDSFLHILKDNEVDEKMLVYEIHQSRTLPYHFWKLHETMIQLLGRKEKNGGFVKMSHYSKYENGRIVIPRSLKDEIKQNDEIDFNVGNQLPAYGFVNLDTNAPRLRITPIPKNKIDNHKRLVVDYRRTSREPETSHGLVKILARELVDHDLGIENVTNTTQLNTDFQEKGKVELIVESSCDKIIDFKKLANSMYHSIKNEKKFNELNVQFKSLNPYKIFLSLKFNNEERIKNFTKLILEAGEEFGILEDNLILVEDYIEPISLTIREQLRECDALIQFYYNEPHQNSAKEFTWINCEMFAMRMLDKPCLTITTNDLKHEDFPTFDRDIPILRVDFLGTHEEKMKEVRKGLFRLMSRLKREHIFRFDG